MDTLGIYIHIPFCIRKCNYCDFCSFPKSDKTDMYKYVDELCRRIKDFAPKAKSKTVDTVYFGGGTPTLLPCECFGQIMDTLKSSFEICEDAEFTVECNPASIDRDGLDKLRRLGINRLSIGLQSANENELTALGRLHSFDDFISVYNDARGVGFDNISVDLMYGIPEQTIESFEKTLRQVCSLSPEHISAYGLKIEDGTVFAAIEDKLELPCEDDEYRMYCLCEKILLEHGYERYEISNFSKPGRESRHNMRYWNLLDYIGFGVAAHSCFEGERFGNSRDIAAFLGGEDITAERYVIEQNERISEYVMLGLRLERGISFDEYQNKTGRSMKEDFPMISQYIEEGFLRETNGRIAFTTKGFFVSNAILSQMLSFE